MSAAALYSLDSPACYKSWCLEPANFYDAKVGSGGGPGPACNGTNLAELSAAAPAMYEDESAIDFSSYIDSMSAVPNLELCNDELFADLFNSNHKPERAEVRASAGRCATSQSIPRAMQGWEQSRDPSAAVVAKSAPLGSRIAEPEC
uniref:CEBPD protein n=1 Tax=Cyanoderma ruficeps TaxID=181631 RepID=A0A8C3RFX6_9PASS